MPNLAHRQEPSPNVAAVEGRTSALRREIRRYALEPGSGDWTFGSYDL